MKKNEVYKIVISLSDTSYDLLSAKCGCKAGKGPKASCKHIGALCYALVEFCKSGQIPEFLSCTELLQQWNRPRLKKVEVIPVDEICARRESIVSKNEQNPTQQIKYNPIPLSLRSQSVGSADRLTEKLRADMLRFNPTCGLLQLLVEVAMHDHEYTGNSNSLRANGIEPSPSSENSLALLSEETCPPFIKEFLNVTPEERNKIEKETQPQFKSFLWYSERARRITGSRCGKILCQKMKTDALLISILYPKPTLNTTNLPLPLKWGIENESNALRKYVQFMRSEGHTNLITEPCGFVIHPTQGWLGASPDAVIMDPTVEDKYGILEIKCPFSKREIHPIDACKDSQFYCTYNDNRIKLKRDHQYYHQVQLQLYVTSDKSKWCDFFIFTNKGYAVERIYPDEEWQRTKIKELEDYYNNYMVPEIIGQRLKPSYVY